MGKVKGGDEEEGNFKQNLYLEAEEGSRRAQAATDDQVVRSINQQPKKHSTLIEINIEGEEGL